MSDDAVERAARELRARVEGPVRLDWRGEGFLFFDANGRSVPPSLIWRLLDAALSCAAGESETPRSERDEVGK